MIHYHGGPITPEVCAIKAWKARHAFISFAHPIQTAVAANYSQSFALDNGAFSMWKAGRKVDWSAFYEYVLEWKNHPGFDFAIIPDVIDGSEADNDKLLESWPLPTHIGVPVWHTNESIERLVALSTAWPRVAIGSSGAYDAANVPKLLGRMFDVLPAILGVDGRPITKLHGLRMLNPKIFTKLPLASADSTNVARNIGIDKAWTGSYAPASKETRASVMVERIEQFNSAEYLDLSYGLV